MQADQPALEESAGTETFLPSVIVGVTYYESGKYIEEVHCQEAVVDSLGYRAGCKGFEYVVPYHDKCLHSAGSVQKKVMRLAVRKRRRRPATFRRHCDILTGTPKHPRTFICANTIGSTLPTGTFTCPSIIGFIRPTDPPYTHPHTHRFRRLFRHHTSLRLAESTSHTLQDSAIPFGATASSDPISFLYSQDLPTGPACQIVLTHFILLKL